jgi:ferric-dicitrate binding protein FerR (iron transport regulator)
MEAPPKPSVAIARRIQGRPQLVRDDQRGGRPQLLYASTPVRVDDVIETDEMSRAAVQATDGSSVRIDHASRVRFVEPAVLEVVTGAAYIVTAEGSHGFEVRTPLGGLRDVGTRFEVRLTASSLRVRVRAGAVEIRRGADVTTASAGTEATITTTGLAMRQAPMHGPEWAWTKDVAPSFAIDGRTLRAFLEHLAGEEGWRLRYADRRVADAAAHIVLHGSVEGLTAEDALRAVLATSGLEHRLGDGELLVSRAADAR